MPRCLRSWLILVFFCIFQNPGRRASVVRPSPCRSPVDRRSSPPCHPPSFTTTTSCVVVTAAILVGTLVVVGRQRASLSLTCTAISHHASRGQRPSSLRQRPSSLGQRPSDKGPHLLDRGPQTEALGQRPSDALLVTGLPARWRSTRDQARVPTAHFLLVYYY